MLGIVLADRNDLAASVVAVRSWRAATGADAVVLVPHPDLVAPFAARHADAAVRSWLELGTPPDAEGAALAALVGDRPAGERAVVLPATAHVLAAPEPLLDGGPVTLVPRAATAPPADDRRPSAADVATRGAVHDRLLAFTVGEPAAAAFLDWWDRVPAQVRPGAAGAFTGTEVLREPGTGTGWWNLHERPLTSGPDGPRAGGAVVRVVDFEGWRLRHAHLLHPEMDRLRGSRDPVLRELVATYAEERRAAGDHDDAEPLPVWPPDPVLQAVLQECDDVQRARALADDPGARDDVLRAAAAPDRDGSVWGLSAYLVRLHRVRADLAAAFPDLHDRADAAGYLAWARGDGAATVPEPFRGPVEHLDTAEVPGPTAPTPDYGLAGVNVIGFFDEPALGVSEIARQLAAGLEAAGFAVERVTVDRAGRPRPEDGDGPLPHRLTLNCVNADLLLAVRRRLRRRVPPDGLSVGVWWWELEELPPSWAPAIELVHEIWAGTTFVGDAFRAATDLPVRDVPLGLGALATPTVAPAEVAGGDYVLVVFDYASHVVRKNPLGAIEAFRRAGLPDDVRLVLKSVGGRADAVGVEEVRLAAAPLGERVVLLDRELAAGEQAALVAGARAFLSLHRSEGLGLTIAEAMLRGVPVVATDHGGSRELLDAATGWPVPWRPGVVPTECWPYPAGARWAEPDLDAAADALRVVLAGGPAVQERVAAARSAAQGRAERIAAGTDLADAARAAIERLVEHDRSGAPEPEPEPEPRRLRQRLGLRRAAHRGPRG